MGINTSYRQFVVKKCLVLCFVLSVNLSSNIFIKLCSVKHTKLYGLFVKAKNISSCSFEKLKNRRIWSVTYLQLVQESVSYKAVRNRSISYKL